MPEWLLTLIISTGGAAVGGIGLSLLAKFLPKEKCADWLWNIIYNALVIVDKFLDLKIGNKTAEQVEEGLFGTIFYVLSSIGQRGDNYLHNNDTDKSMDKQG